MKTETVKIETIQFDPANARRHGEKNLAAIKSSLARFGQQKPIVVDANGVCRAGNGTLAAAKALGWKEIAIVRSPLAGAEATAYAIADNRTSELAEWDDDVLAQTLAALNDEEPSLAISSGFSTEDLERIVGSIGVDEVEPPALETGDREPFQQMAFVLHDSQAEIVKEAISEAKRLGIAIHDENENENGNAIAAICGAWIRSNC